MNKIHSKVWNKELGQLVVASEFAKADSTGVVGGGRSGVLRPSLLCAALFAAGLVGMSGAAWAEVGNSGGTRPGGNSGSMASSPSTDECNSIGGTAAGQATAIGLRAIAVGCGSQARENSVSMGTGAGGGGNSLDAVAIGHNAGRNVDGRYNIAIGSGAGNNVGPGGALLGTNNVAIGRGSGNNVVGEANFALGKFSGNNITGFNNISIGEYTNYNITSNLNIAIGQFAAAYGGVGNSVAIGQKAVASGGSSISIGNASDAFGAGTVVVGYRAGAGSNADRWHLDGTENPGVAFGTADGTGGGYNAFFGAQSGQRVTGGDNVGVGNLAANGLTGNDNVAIGARANNYGNYTDDAGTNWEGSQQSASRTTAIGARTRASADDSVALGHSANASIANSVALGANSTTVAAVNTPDTDINGTTYNFAGGSAAGVVSVGSAEKERQVHNVAAGRISAQSTDAINGSQLYSTNQAVDALADDLDTAGASVAAALGGTSSYNPETHTVTAGLSVQGNNYTNVQEALTYVGQGWNVSVGGETGSANVAPGGSVDFSNTDENIVIARDGTDLTFDLADDLEIGNSITFVDGDTVIDGDSITTNNLTVEGDTRLGDHFTVNDGGVYYDGDITEGKHIVNKTYVDGEIGALANTPLRFVGDAGDDVDRLLGETVNLVGGATDEAALTDGNIGVVASGDDTLEIKLNKDINLGADGSVAIGDAELDNEGLVVTDGGNSTEVGAGTINVTDAAGTTVIGGNQVSVGGDNPIVISGDTGTIGGLTNLTFDPDNITSGQAATEDQLGQVYDVANAGWDVSAQGANATNVGVNSPTGNSVDLNNADGNIVVSKDDDSNDVTFDLAENIDLGENGSLTTGNTVVDNGGVTVEDVGGNVTTVAAGGTTTTDGAGNSTAVGAGTVTVTDAAGETVIGGSHVSVGGDNPILISGDTGTIGGLTNITFDPNATYTGGIAATQEQLSQVNNDLTSAGLDFVGDDGQVVHRDLGEQLSVTGGATGALSEGNIGVTANAAGDGLVVELADNIELTEDGSVTIGDAAFDNDGLTVVDDDGNETTVGADGTTVTDGAGNSTDVGAGTITVADAAGETVIGGNQVSVGGENPIVISGDTGTIGGLTNITFDPDDFTSGQAATEDQLGSVYEVANAGWNVSAQGENATNVGVNSETGNSVDLNNADGNIVITKADDSNDITFDLAENIDLGEGGSLTTGNTVVNNAGVTVEDEDGNVTTVSLDGVAVADDAGNSTQVGAGDISVTDGTGTTAIGGSEISVGGDNPIVISGDVGTIGGLTNTTFDPDATYTGGLAATQEQLSQVHGDLTTAGLNFVGDDGTNVHRDLGEQLSITGGADLDALSEGNIGVTANAAGDGLVVELADNIELTEDGSLTIGDAELDNDGLTVVDADGNVTTVAADGATVDDGAGNSTTVAATGTTVTDGSATTSVEAGVVTVTANPTTGPANTIVIDANTGTIGGLANQTIDYQGFADGSGRAATEEQLSIVNETANAGWNLTDAEGNEVNIGPNGLVTFEGDDNITVAQTGEDQDGVIEVTLNRNLDVDSVTAGNSVLDNDGLVIDDGAGNHTAVGAGTVTVTANPTTGPANTIVIDANTGTIGGLANQDIDYPGFADGSGRAATEEQLAQVNDTANMGWNISAQGDNATNVGPGGSVDLSNTDGNIVIAKEDDSNDVTFDLADDLVIGNSITAGDTFIDTTGVAIGTEVHLGNTGLVINGGPSVTLAGIDAGNLVITNVAPGEISATSTDAVNGSQLFGMGDSIVNVIGGNAELNPDGTITTSDIGGTGHDNIDDAVRAANDAANAGWTATDADGNAANIGPNGSVAFTGDGNISVAQTGEDNNGQVEITLNRDLDVDSITAGNTVIDTDGVQVGDNVHLGDTGLVIEGGPSVTTDGIDAGGSTLTNVAAGVNDTDAVNVGQLNQVAGDVNDLGDRMDVVEGDVADLQAGATGPFQVSQEAPLVPPTPTGANSAAGGSGADASGDNATALGNQAVASGENSTAVGQGAQATHDNSVALGQGSATTVGAQSGYDAAYVGSSDSAGEVNVGNRTITGVAPGVAGTDAVNVNQLNAGVNHAVVTANEYTDQRVNQVQSDVWHLHGRVDDLEKSINSGVATAMAMRQAPYVAGATTYFAGFGAYKDQGALGVSMRRTADNGRWSLEGGFSANRDGAGGYIGVSGVLGSK